MAASPTSAPPPVAIIMGSQSDWPILKKAAAILDELQVPHEVRIVSAHRTPERLYDYAKSAKDRGLKVVIAGAGGAAHLPGMTAALTPLRRCALQAVMVPTIAVEMAMMGAWNWSTTTHPPR